MSFLCDKSGWLNLWIAPTASPQSATQLVSEEVEVSDAMMSNVHGLQHFVTAAPAQAMWDTWRAGTSFYCWLSKTSILYARQEEGSSRLVRIDISFEGPAPRVSKSQELHLVKVCVFAQGLNLAGLAVN